jgi:exodeoxyribonuclease-5
MLWSPQQDHALQSVAKWLQTRDQPIYRLWGYAGTGKSTLARHFAEGVNGQVLFAAFTGKAASVMHSKGCHNASTIHSLIYRTESVFICPDHPDDTYWTDAEGCRRCGNSLMRRPKYTLNPDSPLARASLLIVDECSMVNESLGRDVMSFGVPTLVLGDPVQLPPP